MASKSEVVGDLIARYRSATNHDVAFDRVAAERLGLSVTDLSCVNIVENHRGLTAGELARLSGLTTGAVTAVIDRLQRAGYARRVPDEQDRRKVKVEVTPAFYERAAEVWAPVFEDWQRTLAERFTARELETIAEFLSTAEELTVRHADRLRGA